MRALLNTLAFLLLPLAPLRMHAQETANSSIDRSFAGAGTNAELPADAPQGLAMLGPSHAQRAPAVLPSLRFADTLVASTSPPQTLTLTNRGEASFVVDAVSVSAAFVEHSSTCGAVPFTLAAKTSCYLRLAFSPSSAGQAYGLVEVAMAGAAAQRAILSGTGISAAESLVVLTSHAAVRSSAFASSTLSPGLQVHSQASAFVVGASTLSLTHVPPGPSPDFVFDPPDASPIVVKAGAVGAISTVLQPIRGLLNRTVTVQVDGLPAGTAINIAPATVTLGSKPVPVYITFQMPVPAAEWRASVMWSACAITLCGVLCGRRDRRSMYAAVLLSLVALQACGATHSKVAALAMQPALERFPVSVSGTTTGNDGEIITHTTTFNVSLQP